jgi:G3E family GTPase
VHTQLIIKKMSEGEVPDSEKTPVTIITGFLGSGKTTLVNYILKEQSTWKICVVENEFGEVAIDNELVQENLAAKEDIITMDNGCICCSVRGDLVRTFGMLVARRKEFDAIIIETTGLADPSPIVFTFNSNALIQDNYRIDSVVCLVDAKHVGIHLDEVKPEGNINEAEHQIAFADRIILNKLDLVSKDDLEEIEDRIKSMNSFAKIVKTERSRAPLDQILGLNSFSLDKVIEIDPTLMDSDDEDEHNHEGHVHDEHCGHHVHDESCGHGSSCTEDHDHHGHHEHGHKEHGHKEHGHEEHGHHEHGHAECTEEHDHKEHGHKEHGHKEHGHKEQGHKEHGHDEDHHHHAEGEKKKKKKKTHNLSLVSSVGFTIEGDLDVPTFNTFMSELLQAKAKDLYRTKGVLAFADQGDTKFVFQGVHEQINFGPTDNPWGKDEKRVSKMVFIGKDLDYNGLKEGLLSCAQDPSTAKINMHKR